MKKVILLFCLSVLVSCVKKTNEAPSFELQEIEFLGGSLDETKIVKVRASGEWTINETSIPDWLSITPLSGVDYGDITITIISVNDTNGERYADISLDVNGFTPKSLRIIQKMGTTEELTDGILNKNIEGFYKNGEGVFVLDNATMQTGINTTIKNYFLISDDQTKILSLVLDNTPVMLENSYISVQSKGVDDIPNENTTFMLYKKEDGKLWFYNPSKKIGFITKEIN